MASDSPDDVEEPRTAEAEPLILDHAVEQFSPPSDEAYPVVYSERLDDAKRALVSIAPGFLLGAFIIAFDISYLVANYSRRIASNLNQLENAVWIPLAGSVSDSACQPLYGYFAKRYGRARPAIVASAVLTIGLLLCGASQTLWELSLARVVFGMGASGVPLLAVIVLTDLVIPASLPLYRSVLVIAQTSGFMLGSPLGSWLASATSWHIPFLVESVVAAIGTQLLFFNRRLSFNGQRQDETLMATISTPSEEDNFDVFGSLILLTAVITPLIAINLGGNILAWNHPAEIVLLSSTPFLFVLFLYQEIFRAQSPLIPLRLLRSWPLLKIYLCATLIVFARNQLDLHITFYAEVRSAPGSSFSNWVLPCQFLGITIGSVCSGGLISHFGRFKWLLVGSATLGFLLYLNVACGLIKPENFQFAPALATIGLSLGAADSCLIAGLLSSTKKEDRTMSYALYELIVAISADTAIAVSSALQRGWFVKSMRNAFGESAETSELISECLKSLEYAQNLPSDTKERVLDCFSAALQKVFGISCVLLGLSALIAISLRNISCNYWSEDAPEPDESAGIRSRSGLS